MDKGIYDMKSEMYSVCFCNFGFWDRLK